MIGQYRREQVKARPGPGRRSGTAAVEFALAGTILFFMVFGFLEFGRAMFIVNMLQLAATSGCRCATLPGADEALVRKTIDNALSSSRLSKHKVSLSPGDLSRSTAEWSLVSVTIEIKYSDVSWVPVPKFLGDTMLRAVCSLPREVAG